MSSNYARWGLVASFDGCSELSFRRYHEIPRSDAWTFPISHRRALDIADEQLELKRDRVTDGLQARSSLQLVLGCARLVHLTHTQPRKDTVFLHGQFCYCLFGIALAEGLASECSPLSPSCQESGPLGAKGILKPCCWTTFFTSFSNKIGVFWPNSIIM